MEGKSHDSPQKGIGEEPTTEKKSKKPKNAWDKPPNISGSSPSPPLTNQPSASATDKNLLGKVWNYFWGDYESQVNHSLS